MRPLFFCFSFVLALALALAHSVAVHHDVLDTRRHRSLTSARAWTRAASDDAEDIKLIDIVLVASIDGSFHAVNRTSGQRLWSMSAAATDIPSSLAPLVRTKHAAIDYDLTDDDDTHQELYIIEPQTGDVYVMPTPTSPLQPLSISMSQLVELSPFKFDREDDERVFVGKKETSLLSIELETGKVKTINAECPWNPFEDLTQKDEIDLDELEEYPSGNDESIPTEVFVGRTDYHVAIYTRSASGRRLPIHNLSFSSYGPNMQDNAVQAAYRRTPDNTYIESLPNGQIMSFKARDSDSAEPYMRRESQILWALTFDSPIVAVFDVLSSSRRSEPFVLMQPRPPISDVLQGFDKSSAASIYDPDMAYVGLVEETGSLFVMGNDRFPLIAFGDTEHSINSRAIDPPPSAIPRTDLPDRIDVITKRRKLRELCAESPFDTRCLTGKRPLDASSLNSRQLPGVPSAEPPPEIGYAPNNVIDPEDFLPDIPDTINNLSTAIPSWTSVARTIGERFKMSATLGTVLLAMVFGSTWLFRDKLSLDKLYPWTPRFRPEIQTASIPSPPPALSPTPPLVLDGKNRDTVIPPPSLPLDAGTSPSTLPPDPVAQLIASPTISKEIPDSPGVPLVDDIEESEREGDAADTTPKKRKIHRRRRGKKGKGNNGMAAGAVDDTEGEKDGEAITSSKDDGGVDAGEENPKASGSTTLVVQSTPQPNAPSLIVSDAVLGFGSHGTVVYQGSLQGRAVAVKRLLRDFVTLAAREVSILQESDDHPNVIRYYYQESQGNFLYIALELCPASLADVIESPDQHQEIVATFDPKRALRQITSGLRHLHSLKIIHRDIKPHNILVSAPKNGATGRDGGRRMLISDFGLCKKLEVDQTSFLPTAQGAHAAGTVGWRAPEILRGDVKLDDSLNDDGSQSSTDSTGTVVSGGSTPRPTTRLTKAVDLFALGCLFYYVLTNGSHPFGDKFEREVNIIKNVKNLDGLERFGEEGSEAVDLIGRMLDPVASLRPDTTSCIVHPFFWDSARRLNFLQDASDRFEIMCRDPREHCLTVLETGAFDIVGHDWHTRLDKVFIENLGKFRKYDGKSVQDLLRALRNKSPHARRGTPQKHHYQDLPDHVKRTLGPMPEGFLSYFTKRFPQLFVHVHGVISDTHLYTESMFRAYFELNES
ncbi:kinase-like protein [Imleria badia]|nr:kinase-like protein [Imleria badia]